MEDNYNIEFTVDKYGNIAKYNYYIGVSYIFINITSLGLLIIEIGDNYSKREKILISIIK